MRNERRMLKGSELCSSDRDYVLRAFINRYTGDYKPSWATHLNLVQFASDQEWLENTLFHVTKNHRLDHRHNSCESRPTWPKRHERKPAHLGGF